MSDISAGIFAATELYKIVKDFGRIEREFGKVEIKEHLVDVLGKLVDLKQALVDAQEREFALQKGIAELEAKLADRGRFRDRDGMLFKLDDHGAEIEQPYCNLCFVKEEKHYRLITRGTNNPFVFHCQNCGGFYEKNPNYQPPKNASRFGI